MNRGRKISIRLSNEEYEHVYLEAQSKGVTVGAFVRKKILDANFSIKKDVDIKTIYLNLLGINEDVKKMAQKDRHNQNYVYIMEKMEDIAYDLLQSSKQ